MEKALGKNKTLETLKLSDDGSLNVCEPLCKEFCRRLLFGIGRNTSLSEVDLSFLPFSWPCPIDGRLVYVSHMFCDSVECSV